MSFGGWVLLSDLILCNKVSHGRIKSVKGTDGERVALRTGSRRREGPRGWGRAAGAGPFIDTAIAGD